jgi:acyl carrier protein
MTSDVEQRLREFIAEDIFDDRDMVVPADAPLLSGFLDSFGLMQLLNFIEDEYDVDVANREVIDENFASIRALAAFIGTKLAANG